MGKSDGFGGFGGEMRPRKRVPGGRMEFVGGAVDFGAVDKVLRDLAVRVTRTDRVVEVPDGPGRVRLAQGLEVTSLWSANPEAALRRARRRLGLTEPGPAVEPRFSLGVQAPVPVKPPLDEKQPWGPPLVVRGQENYLLVNRATGRQLDTPLTAGYEKPLDVASAAMAWLQDGEAELVQFVATLAEHSPGPLASLVRAGARFLLYTLNPFPVVIDVSLFLMEATKPGRREG